MTLPLLINKDVNLNTPDDIRAYSRDQLWGVQDLYGKEADLYKPLLDYKHAELFEDNFAMELLDIMMKPEYMWYTCKYLLNVHLAPFQVMMLRELWYRKFPMVIGSRGCGKSFLLALYSLLRAFFTQGSKIILVGAAFRQSKLLFEYIENIWRGSPILQNIVGSGKHKGPRRDIDRCNFYIGDSEVLAIPIGDGCVKSLSHMTLRRSFGYIGGQKKTSDVWGNGKFRRFDEHYDNGVQSTKIVRTKKGFEYEGTDNHRMKVLRGHEIRWVRTDEMVIGDRILIDRSERWHEGNYECTDEQAYALGAMIGDGCWTQNGYLGFATNDADHFIPYLNSISKEKQWKQQGDIVHWNLYGKDLVQDWLYFWELKPQCYTKDKVLPPNILCASQERMTACICGLFDSDGHLQIGTSKGGTSIAIGFTNTSKELVRQLQYILLHYGIVAHVSSRDRDEKWNTVYELLLTGQNAILFAEKIGFRLKRKQDILLSAVKNKIRSTMIKDYIPGVRDEMLRIAQQHKDIPGNGDPNLRHVSEARINDRKNMTRAYIDDFIKKYQFTNDPFIQTLKELSDPNIYYDEITSIESSECHTYDIHVPDGHEYCVDGFFSHNSRIRGLRANYVISDEFPSIPQEVFEVVIQGFTAVSANPMARAFDNTYIDVLRSLGMSDEADFREDDLGFGNQTVISGTAYYYFNHFYEYWSRYKSIIESGGDIQKLEEIFHGAVPESFDWTQFSIIRLPWHKLPKGFMDEIQIAKAKATIHSVIYQMEYEAVFAKDSQGFFKRSLIESCVTKLPIMLPSGPVQFSALLTGNPNCKYVYGIDPASEHDNFAIVILEIHADHRRLAHCWTIQRRDIQERLKQKGQTNERSFYVFCANKIRELLKTFPSEHVGIDSQGGGIEIMGALCEANNIPDGELAIWPYICQGDNDPFPWEKPDKPTDGEVGKHILHMVQFANADFTRDANHGLKKDFESHIVLFPYFDSVEIGLAIEQDKMLGREFDTLEDCVVDIEDLKDELATIQHTQSPSGRDKWDTPEVKLPGGKKGRLRKDRYSALVIANMVARCIETSLSAPTYPVVGGFVGQKRGKSDGRMYTGPDHIVSKMNYGRAVKRH